MVRRGSIAGGAVLAVALALPLLAAGLELQISLQQAQSMGITTALPARDNRSPLQGLSARVVVPNTQMNVVSTPLPGWWRRSRSRSARR